MKRREFLFGAMGGAAVAVTVKGEGKIPKKVEKKEKPKPKQTHDPIGVSWLYRFKDTLELKTLETIRMNQEVYHDPMTGTATARNIGIFLGIARNDSENGSVFICAMDDSMGKQYEQMERMALAGGWDCDS